MRVRAVLVVGIALIVGALALDMSGSAPRTAGSDHVAPAAFSASVPGGGLLCQPIPPLPSDAARASLRIGTYGRPVPALSIRFTDANGATAAEGDLNAGSHEGYVTIPFARAVGAGVPTGVCLRVGGFSTVVLGGEARTIGAGSEEVNRRPQPGAVSLVYLRRGNETWWQLLPVLSRRFGLGKATFIGTWTLPAIVVVMLALWAGTVRLLARELK